MTTTRSKRARVLGLATGGLLAGGVGLEVIGVVAANAAPVLPAATPSAEASSNTQNDTETNGGGAGRRSGETVVTGAKVQTLEASTLGAVPGGTDVRVETDADDAAYEVHVTKAGGTQVTVKFDGSLTEIGVEAGTGKGVRSGDDQDSDDSTSTG